jgi:hypothetical protein
MGRGMSEAVETEKPTPAPADSSWTRTGSFPVISPLSSPASSAATHPAVANAGFDQGRKQPRVAGGVLLGLWKVLGSSALMVAGLLIVASASYGEGNPTAAKSAHSEIPSDNHVAAIPLPSETKAEPMKASGFRSAMFGADEAAVRAAIAKDFSVSPSAIHATQNLSDRTNVLTVKAPDVLNGGGCRCRLRFWVPVEETDAGQRHLVQRH